MHECSFCSFRNDCYRMKRLGSDVFKKRRSEKSDSPVCRPRDRIVISARFIYINFFSVLARCCNPLSVFSKRGHKAFGLSFFFPLLTFISKDVARHFVSIPFREASRALDTGRFSARPRPLASADASDAAAISTGRAGVPYRSR